MKIVAGKKYRAVETFPSGTTVTYEGVAENSVDTELGGATIDFMDGAAAWANSNNVDGLDVTVEAISDPLPTATGSLIRYYPSGRDVPDVQVIQMRIRADRDFNPETKEFSPVYTWVTQNGGKVTDPIGDFDVLFDAGAHD